MTLRLGRGRYVVGECIGEGGMGAVYEAVHEELGRTVAIKVLNEKGRDSEARLARFRREAVITARLEHPNIVDISDVSIGVDGEPPFIVMERLQGETVSGIVRSGGAMDPARAVRLARQLLAALAAAHTEGIVHRDLKPSNLIVVGGYDGGEMLKVVDFGVARLLPETGAEQLTRTGQILGTINYMAPEQAAGAKVDARADLYGAGAVLFSMLAGRPPIRGSDAAEVIGKVLRGDRERLGDIRPDIVALAAAVDRAMAMEPAERFASAVEMSEALEDAMPGTAPTIEWTKTRVGAGTGHSAVAVHGEADEVREAAQVQSSRRVRAQPEGQSTGTGAGHSAVAGTGRGAGARTPILLILAALVAASLSAALVYYLRPAQESARPPPTALTPIVPRPATVPATRPAPAQPVVEAIEAEQVEAVPEIEPGANSRPATVTQAPSGPTCRGWIASYSEIEARFNPSRTIWGKCHVATEEIARACLADTHIGTLDLTVVLDARARVSRIRVRNASFLTGDQRSCIRRMMSRYVHWDELVGPDEIVFRHLTIGCAR